MALALFLNALSWGHVLLTALRYPIPIAVGLYCGGVALRTGWGPIETFAAGFAACAATHAAILAALETRSTVIRASALAVTTGASLWVGVQVFESIQLLAR